MDIEPEEERYVLRKKWNESWLKKEDEEEEKIIIVVITKLWGTTGRSGLNENLIRELGKGGKITKRIKWVKMRSKKDEKKSD